MVSVPVSVLVNKEWPLSLSVLVNELFTNFSLSARVLSVTWNAQCVSAERMLWLSTLWQAWRYCLCAKRSRGRVRGTALQTATGFIAVYSDTGHSCSVYVPQTRAAKSLFRCTVHMFSCCVWQRLTRTHRLAHCFVSGPEVSLLFGEDALFI